MRKLLAGILKEFWLLKRDVHALLVLFVMPAFFILIMSLAMRDAFSEHSEVRVAAAFVDADRSDSSREAIERLRSTEGFEWHDAGADPAKLAQAMEEGDILIAVVVKKGFERSLLADQNVSQTLSVVIDPESTPAIRLLFESALAGTVAKLSMVHRLSALNPWMTSEEKESAMADRVWFEEHYLRGENVGETRPTSVQQSVPAWLIFSMFFIIIPISHTFVTERRLGTLSRLAVMNVSIAGLLVSKFVPYFLINQIQLILMLSVGVWIVPMLGGDALAIGGTIGALAVVSAVLSFATIAYALALASVVRTTDQAVTVGGVLNIIFAAVGGVMIPLFVMPDFMQQLSVVSPMSWALESFLDLFLHHASLRDIVAQLGGLAAFGVLMMGIAAYRLHKELKEAQ